MENNIFLRIEKLNEKKLLGKNTTISFQNNTTVALWKSFMPRKSEIKNRKGEAYYSVEIFEKFFERFDPSIEFEKWACVEVSDHGTIPEGMQALTVSPGAYAVFVHKGLPLEGERTYNYIFREWMPASEYTVDQRPHFAVMGEKYKNDSPDSEEEIWIPVKLK
jgi:AraC family transcriptional regulator